MGLNADTRERIIDVLSQADADSFHEYKNKDFYWLARQGMPGYESMSDSDLVQRLSEWCDHYDDSEDEVDVDPQLNALRSLLSTLTDSKDRKEVQKHIDVRIAQLPPPPPREEKPLSPNQQLLEKARAELAVHDIVSA